MKTPKIATNFRNYRDGDLGAKLQFIINSLTGNTMYPHPDPTIPVLQGYLDGYTTALELAEDGTKEAISAKNIAKKEVIAMFNKVSLYITATAQGNETLLLSSGFDLAKDNAPIGNLPKPENFYAKSENEGCVKMKLNSIHGADSYQYEYKLADASFWTVFVGTKSSVLISGLQSGKAYQFRVAAVGASPTRFYSDVINGFIL